MIIIFNVSSQKMYFFLILLTHVPFVLSRDISVERREETGDIIRGAQQEDCITWGGIWKEPECFCHISQTFYADNSGHFRCFNGTGTNIGCKSSVEGLSKIPSFYEKTSDKPNFTLGNLSPYCRNVGEFQRWSVNGWRLENLWVGKIKSSSLQISWLNVQSYKTEVEGHLFKLQLSSCKEEHSDVCLLFKSLGVRTYSLQSPSTTPSITSIVNRKKTSSSSNNDVAIVVGVLSAVLIIVFVVILMIWLWKREKSRGDERNFLSWLHNLKQRNNKDKDNIYEDIGAKQLRGIKKRPYETACPPRPITGTETHSQYNRAFFMNNTLDYHLKTDEVDDVYETPVEERKKRTSVGDGDVYEMPADGRKFSNKRNAEDEVYDMPEENQREFFNSLSSIKDLYDVPIEDENESNIFSPAYYDKPVEEDTNVDLVTNEDDVYDEPADENKRRIWTTKNHPATHYVKSTSSRLHDKPKEVNYTNQDFYDTPEEPLPPLPLPNEKDTYKPLRYSEKQVRHLSTANNGTNSNGKHSSERHDNNILSKAEIPPKSNDRYSSLNASVTVDEGYSRLSVTDNKSDYLALSQNREDVDDVYTEPSPSPRIEPFYYLTH